jgi:hypothetical protein
MRTGSNPRAELGGLRAREHRLMEVTMTTADRDSVYAEPRGEGWIFFVGTVLGLAGVMRIIDGIWALHYKGTLPNRLEDGLLGDNLRTYGWVWIGVGAVLILASFGVLARSQVSRWIGFIAAVVLAVSATFWLPYYPVWSLIYIAIAVMAFYALARYGGRGE